MSQYKHKYKYKYKFKYIYMYAHKKHEYNIYIIIYIHIYDNRYIHIYVYHMSPFFVFLVFFRTRSLGSSHGLRKSWHNSPGCCRSPTGGHSAADKAEVIRLHQPNFRG